MAGKSAKSAKDADTENNENTKKAVKGAFKSAKGGKSNKTEAVMRLLTGGKKTAPNPILDSSFKVERITSKSVRKG
ncbi:MAG: hypothetical protein K2K34_09240, partial [Oscillospiraceae bacterium]|nr:hypothetical protein [Oscillospiraceae bacterium]